VIRDGRDRSDEAKRFLNISFLVAGKIPRHRVGLLHSEQSVDMAACLGGPIMSESENQTRPSRNFGVVRHSFPQLTQTEKAFVGAFVFSGLVAAIVLRPAMHRPDEYAIGGLCAYIMGPTLCYWMWHEPGAVLQLLLFRFRGWQVKWPPVVLMLIRGFGIVNFIGCLLSFPLVFLPASWTNNLLGELVVLVLTAIISVRALRKRSLSVEPQTHL
jgi:hypothetical protein